jgi:tripartite-type tricarboxylate transporter receptor subunit TctC
LYSANSVPGDDGENRVVTKLIRVLLSIVFVASAAAPSFALDYPNKYVRIIIPFPPGGGSEVQARALALELGKIWGHQVIVENKPGAGTTIGANSSPMPRPTDTRSTSTAFLTPWHRVFTRICDTIR